MIYQTKMKRIEFCALWEEFVNSESYKEYVAQSRTDDLHDFNSSKSPEKKKIKRKFYTSYKL